MGENLWKTSRLVFRAVETSDEPFLAELNTHSLNLLNAAHFLPLPQNHKAIVNFREYLEKALVGVLICLSNETNKTEDGNDGDNKPKPIGAMTLTRNALLSHHRNAGIGINILPGYQGQGYGSEAIKWMLEYAFMTIGLHRVEIGSFEYNARASMLYERLGFVREGFVRESLYSQGRWWGEFKLGMLEDEWRALREKGEKGAL